MMSDIIKFVVYCKPEPQGSSRAYIPKGWTRAVITSDNPKLKGYRSEVAKVAALECRGRMFPSTVAVDVALNFVLTRPKSARRRLLPTVRPDLDKLIRATFDSLTGIVYADDAQVVRVSACKQYGSPQRVEISVRECIAGDVRTPAELAMADELFVGGM